MKKTMKMEMTQRLTQSMIGTRLEQPVGQQRIGERGIGVVVARNRLVSESSQVDQDRS